MTLSLLLQIVTDLFYCQNVLTIWIFIIAKLHIEFDIIIEPAYYMYYV